MSFTSKASHDNDTIVRILNERLLHEYRDEYKCSLGIVGTNLIKFKGIVIVGSSFTLIVNRNITQKRHQST